MADILLFHGMAEHHNRYEYFVDYMTDLGYSMYLYDHRGHGTDTKIDDLGFFANTNGYKRVIDDALKVANYVKTQGTSGKTLFLGHSMGSLILRNVLTELDSIDGAIICGTTYPDPLTLKAGLLVSKIISLTKGPKYKSLLMNKLLFGSKLYTNYCKRTSSDWLTRDNRIVAKYIHDPYCGFICSASFYSDLIRLALNASKANLMLKVRKDLPLYIISGEHDPVGGNGKEVQKLYDFYTSSGYSNVELHLYSECRHEILNELNKDDIIDDLCTWINAQILT